MENQIKVSVIIPVYQVESYLERAVDSVLAQTLEEKEIILVDDGSTDASPQICDCYAQSHPELIRVIHKPNAGLGMARNSGVEAAKGKYIAFLDSDDAVEPEMYEQLYQKAEAGNYDIVMCDVNIIYVEENRQSLSRSYPSEEIDLPDYIANGNNITYSVNKLFRREIWEENRYEKMLFEDIALIPALMTRYRRVGYVQKAFYNYYRRPNTISTSFTGSMADIIRAFQMFLDNSSPAYREEAVYCIAKQLYWNMTKSRVLFQADFITFLQKNEKDFRLNRFLPKDPQTKKLLDFLEQRVLPERFICPHIGREIPAEYFEQLREHFPHAELVLADEYFFAAEQPPASVRAAMTAGNTAFAEEYLALRILCEQGGIVLMPWMRANLNLKRLRLNRIFFGFRGGEELETGCFGAEKSHYVIQALLMTYQTENLYNQAFLPLRERLRDFLILRFGLKPNGKSQLLKKEIQVCLPSVLSYDMQNGENCCKRADIPVPEGYQAVEDDVLRLWSGRILDNWNLYKKALGSGNPLSPDASPLASVMGGISEAELERQLRELAKLYENSTSWRITRPVRALSDLVKKIARKG